jgi:hypothetical protein
MPCCGPASSRSRPRTPLAAARRVAGPPRPELPRPRSSPHLRDLCDLMSLGLAHLGSVVSWQLLAAPFALLRPVVHRLVDLLGWDQRSERRTVPRLSPGAPAAWLLLRRQLRRRWVARWRLRRVRFSRRSNASSRPSSSCTRARRAVFSASSSWIRATRVARSRNQGNRRRRLSRGRSPRQLLHLTKPALPVNGYACQAALRGKPASSLINATP